MRKFFLLMTLLSVPFLVGACQTTKVTNPCDVLVDIQTKKETNTYLVTNDREAAVGIARNQGRVEQYGCKE